ncbi:LOW QUALITY PROTEIN: T-cell ecto-ADP-ribosyltransferase 1-like [Erinaceus europaeus]|uniref:NAD(P)(+)--arginine ADP-ribosyltransferase n=1 Tax=Erinaceus europaeus TaxID=9365 RepID=A0A1S3A0T8_ERIEU|nr:LOW QUALITY PROTEIN: T-cell ecto-ADP-ribosyltransferase 1-like [Erinaceus europaeus]
MAEDAFDDQYEGCAEDIEKMAPQLLKEELENSPEMKTEWEAAKKEREGKKNKIKYSEQFNDFHGTALVAYTGSIAVEFNKAVRNFHQNTHGFQFKAFHYYLMRALQLLGTGQCYTVYRGCKTKFHDTGSRPVRFGQFTSSSFSKDVALGFSGGYGTVFTIQTCLGVAIEKFSFFPHEKEVLIPGYEVYQKVTKQSNNNILLQSPQKSQSNVNCFYTSAGMKESSLLLLLLPGLLVLLLLPAELEPHCRGLSAPPGLTRDAKGRIWWLTHIRCTEMIGTQAPMCDLSLQPSSLFGD